MILVLILFGSVSGGITAAGLFSLITSVGIINRYADVTGTKDRVFLYEECIIWGASIANALFVLQVHLNLGKYACVGFGIIAGIFVGTFLISLAEMMKGLPIFLHRFKLKTCLGCIVTVIAFGKTLGQLFYYLYLY